MDAVLVNTRTPANIRAEKTHWVLANLRSTNYTQFGVWRQRDYQNATRSSGETNRDRENDDKHDGPGMFAYSQLKPAIVLNLDDPAYTPGGSASYYGETVAVQNTTWLTGRLQVDVTWMAETVEGTVNVTLSDLANGNGDMLAHSGTASNPGNAIRDIVLHGVTVSAEEVHSNELRFHTDDASVRYRHVDPNVTDASVSEQMLKGVFVGQGVDGPLGVIGVWSLDDGNVGRRNAAGTKVVDATNVIYGAFGAELP